MSINSYSIFESRDTIIMNATVDEKFINGNIVIVSVVHFYNKHGVDIGFAKVIEDDQHKKIKADYNGRKLLEKFQYISA